MDRPDGNQETWAPRKNKTLKRKEGELDVNIGVLAVGRKRFLPAHSKELYQLLCIATVGTHRILLGKLSL